MAQKEFSGGLLLFYTKSQVSSRGRESLCRRSKEFHKIGQFLNIAFTNRQRPQKRRIDKVLGAKGISSLPEPPEGEEKDESIFKKRQRKR